ncbi:UNVERIFIED_CONTAM: hypothetical protein FKN15_038911 [Acipenser sinensis]
MYQTQGLLVEVHTGSFEKERAHAVVSADAVLCRAGTRERVSLGVWPAVRCRAMRRNSPGRFYLPNPRDRQSQCEAPFRVPSEDQPTPHSQDVNLRCMTHPAHRAAALLPVGDPFSTPSTKT